MKKKQLHVRYALQNDDKSTDEILLRRSLVSTDTVTSWEQASAESLDSLRRVAVEFGCPEDRLAPGFEKRVIEITGSDDSIDRYNSRVLQDGTYKGVRYGDGWQLKNFRNNPVLMPIHDYEDLPIGQALHVYSETLPDTSRAAKKDSGRQRTRFILLFTTAEENPLGDTMFRLYKGGFMRASSVGWIPLKIFRPDTEEEFEAVDLPHHNDSWFPSVAYATNELLEISAVPIPGNPNALLEEQFSPEQLRDFVKIVDETDELSPDFADQLRSYLTANPKWVELSARASTTAGDFTLSFECTTLASDDGVTCECDTASAKIETGDDDAEGVRLREELSGVIESMQEVSPDAHAEVAQGASADAAPEGEGEGEDVRERVPEEGQADPDAVQMRGDEGGDAPQGLFFAPEGDVDVSEVPSEDAPVVERSTPSDNNDTHVDAVIDSEEVSADIAKPDNDAKVVSAIAELTRSDFSIQALIFPKDHWTREQAFSWVEAHEFGTEIDERTSEFRFRQSPPGDFEKDRLRTICVDPAGGGASNTECRIRVVGGPRSTRTAENALFDSMQIFSESLDGVRQVLEVFNERLIAIEASFSQQRSTGTPPGPKDPDGNEQTDDLYEGLLDTFGEIERKLVSSQPNGESQ